MDAQQAAKVDPVVLADLLQRVTQVAQQVPQVAPPRVVEHLPVRTHAQGCKIRPTARQPYTDVIRTTLSAGCPGPPQPAG